MRCLLVLVLLPALVLGAPVEGRRGMVVSAHPLASEAGRELLRSGGNAVDAAVATAFALAVVEPSASGLGGGGFALVRMDEAPRFLDFRETAPAAASETMFLRDGRPAPALSKDGALAAGVPGAVAGYLALLERYGRLPRAKVLAPAIRLAETGFAVDERYRYYASKRLTELSHDEATATLFLRRDTSGVWAAPAWGSVLVQKDLARTLKAIAKQGARGFYGGDVAGALEADMRARGGLVTRADLASYRPVWREPLLGTFRGHALATAPLPSAGGHLVLSMLEASENAPPATPRNELALLTDRLHASRQAYADRVLLGDPAFIMGDVLGPLRKPGRMSAILNADRIAHTPATPGRGTPLDSRPGDAGHEGENTTHLCVVDADGHAVSLTTTVNYFFGAAVVATGTGVLWNDEMDDFAVAPGAANAWELPGAPANRIAPGKRPLSSMAPTIVFEGADVSTPVRLVVGAPGGARIPVQVAETIDAHLRLGEDVASALATRRLMHPWTPDVVLFEQGALDPSTREALTSKGFRLQEDAEHRRWGNASAIAVDPVTGLRTGAADPRGVGTALAQ
jgi:gamma-glutamyltranspeptidase/glutathione hydrolase